MATEEELQRVRRRLFGLIAEEQIAAVDIDRPALSLLAAFSGVTDLTPSVSDALDQLGVGGAVGASTLVPLAAGQRMIGPAITIRYAPEAETVGALAARGARARLADRDLYNVGQPGDVAVFDCGGFAGASVMGGLSAAWARHVEIAGCVVDGAVRDVGSIREEGVQVWSRAVTPVSGKHRLQAIEINGTVTIAGLVVQPGDVIAADDTGVCVIPAGHMQAVRDLALAAEETEREVAAAIAGGGSREEVSEDSPAGEVVGGAAELRALSATEIARAVATDELAAVEVVDAHVAALTELKPLNAMITTCGEEALARAAKSDGGPLAGVPVVVKDLFDTAGVRTTYGSRIYANHFPDRTARAVAQLERAGAVVIGKANLHEFAWGTTSQNPHWGFVESPVLPGHVAGGSSGGNAAALAKRVGALALGTDTAGSIRIPSACCATVGFKPASGAVSSEGCMPLAPSFDVAGPMARTVADCALAYSVLTGAPVPAPSLDGLVAGVIAQPPQMSVHDPGGPPRAGRQRDMGGDLARLEHLGARLEDALIEPPAVDLLPVMLWEAAEAHSELFPARRDDYGPDTKLKWDAARAVDPEVAAAARAELPRWRERARGAAGPDLYVSPTLAGAVPRLDVWEPDVRVAMVGYTRTFSFLGWPAIAIGDLQLAGPDTETVLRAALAWEDAYGPPAAP